MLNIIKKTDDFRSSNPSFSFDKVINDLEQSIEEFGIKVLYSDMSTFNSPDSISGYTHVNEKGVPEIVVNAYHVEGRRRFTMAHELGHIILHWNWPYKRIDRDKVSVLFRSQESAHNNSIQEQEANEFAAQLLAPLDVIEQVIPKNIKEYSAIEKSTLVRKISRAFNITIPFARIQLNKLEKLQEEISS